MYPSNKKRNLAKHKEIIDNIKSKFSTWQLPYELTSKSISLQSGLSKSTANRHLREINGSWFKVGKKQMLKPEDREARVKFAKWALNESEEIFGQGWLSNLWVGVLKS